MINPMDLTGKTILVAGASGGIGRHITKIVYELGAKVIAMSRDAQKMHTVLSEIHAKDIASYQYDFYNLEGIEDVIKRIVEENGKLDGFVYSIGMVKPLPIRNMKPARLEEGMRINYHAFVELVRCLVRKNRCNSGASFVALSSVSSIKGDRAKLDYCSAKAALDAAVRCMAYELEGKVRVNSIQPAGVKTDLYLDYLNDNRDSRHVQDKMVRQFMGLIDPMEIANVAAFLLSDATKTISGTSILMDGGMLI